MCAAAAIKLSAEIIGSIEAAEGNVLAVATLRQVLLPVQIPIVR